MADRGIEVAVDVGGTFTDVVCRTADGNERIIKIATTRADPSLAVMQAVHRLIDEEGVTPTAVRRFVHGTTIATNAVLERKGARIGL